MSRPYSKTRVWSTTPPLQGGGGSTGMSFQIPYKVRTIDICLTDTMTLSAGVGSTVIGG